MSHERFGHLPRRIANAHHASGPLAFLNPTTRYVKVAATTPSANGGTDTSEKHGGHVAGAYQVWRSRDNRKGRHAIVLTDDFVQQRRADGRDASLPSLSIPRASNSLRGVRHGLYKMLVRWPVWDVSYDVALLFSLGSVVWVLNSFFVWLPLAAPATAFPDEETVAGGVSALVGATIFEVGAVLGLLEAVNENRADCFGWALEEALESGTPSLRPSDCRHAHPNRRGFFKGMHTDTDTDTDIDPQIADRHRRWTWWPTAHELRTVYMHEMGFWGCAIQLLGATVFWISSVTGLPPIYSRLSTAAADGVFWLPQVVGGVGFVVSSAMFMIETQRAWYVPAPAMLGWHIGLWNLVGSVGFTLCGALGFGAASSSAVAYASALSTFVGSWAFLIGSLIQWYESLDKYTVLYKSLPRHVLGELHKA